MKKLYILLLFFTVTVFSNDIHKIKLNEGQKVESTYSGNTKKASVHTVVVKNKGSKNYELLVFLAGSGGEVIQMENLTFSFKPSVISHHQNGSMLTIVSHRDEMLSIVNYNIETTKGTIEHIENFGELKSTFRLNNKTVIVQYNNAKDEIKVNEIGPEGFSEKKISIPKKDHDKYKDFFYEEPQAVNTNEFIKNGPINSVKCYYTDNSFVVTKDDSRSGTTKALIVNPESGALTFNTFLNKPEKNRSLISFVSENNLVSLSGTRENMAFKSFDLKSGEEKAFYDLKGDMAKFLNNGITTEEFLKKANKANMKATVTINKSGKNHAVRVDAVNINTYNYHYNWWFHHWFMQQQMMHHQMMMNNMRNMQQSTRGYGPSPEYYDIFILDFEKKEDYSFTFLMNENFELLPDTDFKTDFQNIDKDKYLEPLSNNKSISELSVAFTENEVRYIYQDKKTKELIIRTDAL